MRNRAMALCLLLPILVATPSCDPVTAVAVPILVITANWNVDGQPGRQFLFSANQDDSNGLAQGTFTGEDTTGFDSRPLSGSWANGEIRFTVQYAAGNRLYVGTFTTDRPNVLSLQSPQETITLRRPAD